MTYYGYDEMNMLTRANWTGTWPEKIAIEANDALLVDINPYQSYKGIDGSTTEMPTMGADNGMTLGMMIGKDYDDPDWDKLLDQVTYEEMAELVGKGYHNIRLWCRAFPSLPTTDDNGPQGFTQTLTRCSHLSCCLQRRKHHGRHLQRGSDEGSGHLHRQRYAGSGRFRPVRPCYEHPPHCLLRPQL